MVQIGGLQKLTLLDYPGRVACTVFTVGCNFRCPFCHNSGLLSCAAAPEYSESEILRFLESRRGRLEGVCVSGGEPLLQRDLPEFLRRIKDLGYPVKLDTNGSFPDRLRRVVEDGLVDYVAMDVKNSPARYAETTGVSLYGEAVARSVAYLQSGAVDCEFRTTVVRELHTPAEMADIGAWLRGARRYYLQGFVDSERVLQPGLHAYNAVEMESLRQAVLPFVPAAELRGVG